MVQTEELQVGREEVIYVTIALHYPSTERILRQPPPSYYSQTESVSSGPLPPPHPATFKTKPTNFLLLSKEHNTHRRRIHIDPCILIPSSILPPLGEDKTEDDHNNPCLTSEFGSVNAETWLLGTPTQPSAYDHGTHLTKGRLARNRSVISFLFRSRQRVGRWARSM